MYQIQEELKKCKSIAVMGGTFDPIHIGHLATAEAVRYAFNVDKVLFIPVGRPSHKIEAEVSDNEHRFNMTKLAIESNPSFIISRTEVDRIGKTYSIDTIKELRSICGDQTRIYFITGADAIEKIFTWKEPRKLMKICEFIAVTRPGYKKSQIVKSLMEIIEEYGSKIYYTEVPALDISSTDIRDRVRTGRPIRYLVPQNVEKYILDNNIYPKDENSKEAEHLLEYNVIQQRLQSILSIERYIHTLGVVKTARRLAQKYGVDTDKAALAALLHDCAKDYPVEMKKRFCKEYHVPIDEYMEKAIDLVHPFLGAEVAKREFKVTDLDILSAISYHTTGRPNMSMLEKIVFVADYIEPNRKKRDGLDEIRELAFEDLDLTIKVILEKTIDYIKGRGQVLHPLSLEALDYYSK